MLNRINAETFFNGCLKQASCSFSATNHQGGDRLSFTDMLLTRIIQYIPLNGQPYCHLRTCRFKSDHLLQTCKIDLMHPPSSFLHLKFLKSFCLILPCYLPGEWCSRVRVALALFCHPNHHRILLCAKLGSGGVERVRARSKVSWN